MASEVKGETGGIVIQNDRVLRPLRANANNIHGLLTHLKSRNFRYSPTLLGVDEYNREVLSFIPGEAGHYGSPALNWSDESLLNAFQILRQYHDCTVDFVDSWRVTLQDDESGEVICHNDYAPYNLIYQDGQIVGVIDFDHAAPGTRLWDIAHALYRFVPLSTITQKLNLPSMDIKKRIKIAMAGYGPEDTQGAFEVIYRRVEHLREYTRKMSLSDTENASRIIREGHIESYDEDLAFLLESREWIQSCLEAPA